VGPTGNKFKLLQLNTRENKASCWICFILTGCCTSCLGGP
jgi:hypothetical protein